MDIQLISSENRQQVNDLMISLWYSTVMVIRGEFVDTAVLDGFAAYDNKDVVGLVTYRIKDDECEIVSLASSIENQGIGTSLIHKVKEIALEQKCSRLKLITTNDNINALRFYQK
ncbi:MAG: GNAT family N-acetyltransferase [Anaerocolumna sp.]